MTADGVIHDIGYRPYTGPRLGRRHIVKSLYLYSLRAAFGSGRSAKARIVPLGMFAVICLPAVVSVYKVAVAGGGPLIPYDQYAYRMFLPLLVFVATAAPELVSRDLRHRTLPLYFARPLRRGDYPLAKLLALASAILLFEAVPLIMMYLGTIASADSGSGVWGQTRQLAPGLLVAAVYGIVLAPLTLSIASSSGRRAVVTGAIAILFLVTYAVSGVLESVGTQVTVDAPASGGPPAAAAAGPPPRVHVTRSYDAIAREGGLTDPLRLIEGTRIRALDATDGQIPDPGSLAGVYEAELVLLTGLTTGWLFLRYRKAGLA